MSRVGAAPSADISVAKALSHPLRQRLLTLYSERDASPKELAEALGAKLGDVSYHTKQLLELGCIQLVGTARRRGGVQHFYRATGRYAIGDEQWRGTPPVEQEELVAGVLGDVLRDLAATAPGTAFRREDAHLSRTLVELDDAGWAEVAQLLRAVVERAVELDRAGGSGTVRAELAMLLFEVSPTAPEPARPGRRAGRAGPGARVRRATR